MANESKPTPGPWSMHKCPCGDAACNQYRLSNQMSAGFTESDARLMIAAPALLALAIRHAQSIEYYARMDEKNGDDEGAQLKRVNLAIVRGLIACASGA